MPRNIVVARSLAVLAILSVPGIIWFGWWHLGWTVALAVGAALFTPRPAFDTGRVGLVRGAFRAVNRRLNPHSWRPPIR
jgi:hypothetical protein